MSICLCRAFGAVYKKTDITCNLNSIAYASFTKIEIEQIWATRIYVFLLSFNNACLFVVMIELTERLPFNNTSRFVLQHVLSDS